ncbi:hypothetical protein QE152_g13363 [Popillia japonica]|uniref:Uncharacterized protein n=1 Tax=Popillia japonica TaxID=7064 RepID=A0AAW1LD37_POPJA
MSDRRTFVGTLSDAQNAIGPTRRLRMRILAAHAIEVVLTGAPRCGRIGNYALGAELAFVQQSRDSLHRASSHAVGVPRTCSKFKSPAFVQQSRDSLHRASSHAVGVPRTCSKFKSPEPDLSQQRESHLIYDEEGQANKRRSNVLQGLCYYFRQFFCFFLFWFFPRIRD